MTDTPKNWEKLDHEFPDLWDALAEYAAGEGYADAGPKYIKDRLERVWQFVELETACEISIAASAAGLAPKDLAKAEDWKKAVKAIRDATRSEVIEEIWDIMFDSFPPDMENFASRLPDQSHRLLENFWNKLSSLKSKETPKE